jgi:Fe-S-cluster-containing dehydrogenase component
MPDEKTKYSRREFLKVVGQGAIGLSVGLSTVRIFKNQALAAIPASTGYLLVDMKKCAGCMSCMLACSLVHEGRENLSLSRIQVVQYAFEPFPEDIEIIQCRQCVEPACVEACPTNALHAAPKHGHVRLVDYEKCIACLACVEECPYTPSRAVWDYENTHAQKCDLCAQAPHWTEKGGPGGKQACVEICPMSAITFTHEIPDQDADDAYQTNLRGPVWKQLGFTVD